MTNKKKIFGIAGVVIGVLIALLPPLPGLTALSMRCLGIFVGTVLFWIGDVYPFFLTTLAMGVLMVITKTTSFNTVFAGYSNSMVWFMLGAMGIAGALTKSGLMKRLSYSIMRLFSPTFLGQTIGLNISGLIINPLIPSVTAKTAMVMPIAEAISNGMGYEKKSKGRHGLFGAAFVGITITSHAFYSSNFHCIYVRGMLSEELQAQFGFAQWFLASLPWLLIVMIGMELATLLLYKPAKTTGTVKSKEFVLEELKKMGPMSKDEKISGLILLVSVALWATEKLHGIPSHMVAVTAAILLVYTGVLSANELVSSINWSMLVLCGVLITLGNVFAEVGINDYIAKLVSPMFGSGNSNPFILLTVISVIVYLMRFIVTAQMASLPIIFGAISPIAVVAGINPWVLAFTGLTATATWTVLFQNTFAIQGFAAFGGDEGVKYGEIAKHSICYMLVNIIGILGSIPFWKIMGLM
ncbi:MAG: anion permease [Lachnospiraceae bacterium]|nr:anion permease [Lachnospiraceae bacterium]